VLELAINIGLRKADFALTVDKQFSLKGIIGVHGHSGAGKSSLLRVIAGLERHAKGVVTLAGECWQDSDRRYVKPAYERRIGYVFQEPRLFDHMDVAGNLRYATKRAKMASDATLFATIVDSLRLAHLLPRQPSTLSGGEQQRVAIARALLTSPRLLLLDEPLSAVDNQHKGELIALLRKINQQFQIPIIYVSHSTDELATLTDQLLLLRDGSVIAFDDTARLMSRLDLVEMSSSREAGSVIEARVKGYDEEFQLTQLSIESSVCWVPGQVGKEETAVRLRIHARDVAVALERPKGLSIRNILPATLSAIEMGGAAHADVLGVVGNQMIRARLTRASVHELKLEVGQSIYLLIKAASVEAD